MCVLIFSNHPRKNKLSGLAFGTLLFVYFFNYTKHQAWVSAIAPLKRVINVAHNMHTANTIRLFTCGNHGTK